MVYNQGWHAHYSDTSYRSAQKYIAYLKEIYQPSSFVEFGAGFGNWTKAAVDFGIQDVLALDGEWTDLTKIVVDRDRFRIQDLSQPVDIGRRFDMALSVEVAEHIPQSSARTFINSLIKHSDLVVFGAAIPLQGGFRHINEQWPRYWASLFSENNYRIFDILRPVFWNDNDISYFYRQNTFVFVNEARPDLIRLSIKQRQIVSDEYMMLDVVHPDKFTEAASYKNISLRRLLPLLPQHAINVIKRKLKFSNAG